jgi:hypothetical protein
VDTESEMEEMRLQVFGTGHEIPDDWEHVGTVQDGEFVWHIFEELPAPPAEDEFQPAERLQ